MQADSIGLPPCSLPIFPILCAVGLLVADGRVHAAQSSGCRTARVSGGGGTAQADGYSNNPALSADGRIVAFSSTATNLVPGDTNSTADLFVLDRANGSTQRVSVNGSGVEGNGYSWGPQLSADGRFVLFESESSNLVPGDVNGGTDVYLYDRVLGQLECESVDAAGVPGNGEASWCAMSPDARWIAFHSSSTDLVPGDLNGKRDVFVRDRQSGTTELVSVDSSGRQGNLDSYFYVSISADGRFVAFDSYASNLVPGDTNGKLDVFVRDRLLGQTTRISVSSNGSQANDYAQYPRMSSNGRWVAFESKATNLVAGTISSSINIFVHDLLTGATELASVNSSGSPGVMDSKYPFLSADGRLVAFISDAPNLVPGDTNNYPDVFVHDRETGTTIRVDVDSNGGQVTGLCQDVALSATGSVVAFDSAASNLVPGDTNNTDDVFVRDCTAAPWKYCAVLPNSQGCTSSISWSGTPSATAGSGFTLSTASLLNNTFGYLVYGGSGPSAVFFGTGVLCVQPPLHFTSREPTGGSPNGTDCSGALSIDFNAWIANGQDPRLVAGQRVWAQFLSRDHGALPSRNVALSEAVEFTIEP